MTEGEGKLNYRSLEVKVRNVIESQDYKDTIGQWIEKDLIDLPYSAATEKDSRERDNLLGQYLFARGLKSKIELIFIKADKERKEIRRKQKELNND